MQATLKLMHTCVVAEMFISQYLRGGAMPPVPDWKHYTVGWAQLIYWKSLTSLLWRISNQGNNWLSRSHTPELEYTNRMLNSMGLKVYICQFASLLLFKTSYFSGSLGKKRGVAVRPQEPKRCRCFCWSFRRQPWPRCSCEGSPQGHRHRHCPGLR